MLSMRALDSGGQQGDRSPQWAVGPQDLVSQVMLGQCGLVDEDFSYNMDSGTQRKYTKKTTMTKHTHRCTHAMMDTRGEGNAGAQGG